ncbi:substrate-binding domain-containing protein, partial [Streptomyces sp. NPDC002825]|uniref:substrate-binding domain-containing protein n=1 Tax=Streptomyces sp. NPDC002825 TaxID=3154666 RepID=UPI00332AC982
VYATTEPPITTLSLKPRRIGTAVVQLLIDAIEEVGEYNPDSIVMPYELIVRASSTRGDPAPRPIVPARSIHMQPLRP